MPRPGPRPYECVRRAWHSDRHKPMRGSLIQEIFRVVNENHSTATKKNKEWQMKLPIVVLKAEEIMYSKANSEDEYMDLKTLWDRINDAINTIIRREESSETGDLLQPCIEAALILGCTARRTSRSQRNNTPRCYLNPTSTQEPNPITPRAPTSAAYGGSSCLPLRHSGNPTPSPLFLPYPSTTTMNRVPIGLESCSPVSQDNNPTTMPRDFPFSSENFYPSPASNPNFPLEIHQFAKFGRVYPLFYGAHHQTSDPLFGFHPLQSSNFDNVAVPNPDRHRAQHIEEPIRIQSVMEPTEKAFFQDLYPCEGVSNTASRIRQVNLSSTCGSPEPEIECDLSLRLGPVSVDDVGSSSSQGVRSYDPSRTTDEEFNFFNKDNGDEILQSFPSEWSSQGLSLNLEGPSRKRKQSTSSRLIESASDSSPNPKSLTNLFFGGMSK